MMYKNHILNKLILFLVAAILVLGVAVVILDRIEPATDTPQEQVDLFANLNLEQPEPSFLLLRYVSERRGDQFQRRLAIQWLSDRARLRQPLSPEQNEWLLEMVKSGGHNDWDIEETLWTFNNAFNVLHLGDDQEGLSRLLQDLAVNHPHMTMRNYAVQHIEVQRGYGNLEGKLADELYASLMDLAKEDKGDVTGAALLALINWNDTDAPASQELIDLALNVAADTELTTEVRVTALHAAGEQALGLSRAIAPDTSQPIHMRKAAIGCIGQHGTEEDTKTLHMLAGENFRIAQATKPAIEGIRHRATEPKPRQLIEF